MAVTSELSTLHRTVEELRRCVGSLRSRYGDIPAVRRIAGDVDRIDLDAADLDHVSPAQTPPDTQLQILDDTPPDPALWADADDEGIGGYHHGTGR
ncbi:MAG TPA: hypothetical protein VK816_11010 [Jatrophihabitantaceae bacterium]|jgi:hypothetical protein|nr:hypothetical protein [Jatrophihabitantaceae bacterium]